MAGGPRNIVADHALTIEVQYLPKVGRGGSRVGGVIKPRISERNTKQGGHPTRLGHQLGALSLRRVSLGRMGSAPMMVDLRPGAGVLSVTAAKIRGKVKSRRLD
jgi:hypothetical protein